MLKPGTCVKIVEYLKKEQPLLIKDAAKQVEKIEPHYHYFGRTLCKIFGVFLERRNITEEYIQGVNIPRQAVAERTLFIAVVLWLYSPAVFNTKVSYNVEDGVRHELEGILLCNESWISQQVSTITSYYNSNYQEFRDMVNSLLEFIKAEVNEKKVIETEPKPEIILFQ